MILRQILCLMGMWVVLTVLGLVAADPTQPYIVSLTDQSPTIQYLPQNYGNGSNSWNVSYSLSPWSNFSASSTNVGQGTSVHWTNTTNATIGFEYVGTGFTAYGQLGGSGSLSVDIDGATITIQPTPTNTPLSNRPTLASASGQAYGYHAVQLTLRGNGSVEFYGVDLMLASGATGATYSNTTFSCFNTNNQTLNDAFMWSPGGWSVVSRPSVDGTSSIAAYTNHDNSSMAFTPPSNTSIMYIYGDIGPYMAQYSVSLNSDVYNGFGNKIQPQYAAYQAVTPWAENNQVIYYATIVPGHAYAVNLQLVGPSSNSQGLGTFAITSVVFISSSTDGASTTTTSIGPSSTQSNPASYGHDQMPSILGGVLGAVSGLLIIFGVWWFIDRRRRIRRRGDITRNKVESPDPDKQFEVDPYIEMTERLMPEVRPFSPLDAQPREPRPGNVDRTRDNEKARMTGFTTATQRNPGPASGSGSPQAMASPTATIAPQPGVTIQYDPLQVNTGPTHLMDGLDPSDPAFARKWEILRSLDSEADPSRLPNSPSTSSPTPTTSRARDVDAGRLEGGEDMLPPDYNPAWAPPRQ